MKLPLVGPTYQERSKPFDAQRTINLYPVMDRNGGKEVSALYGTPGLKYFSNIGLGPIRGEFAAANKRAFVVSGSGFYEIDASGAATQRGALDQSSGIITMDENGEQLAICDGKSLYIYTYAVPANSVTNGTFDSDTVWTKGAGWTIGSGLATATGGISTSISQTASIALKRGRTYVVDYDISVSAGTLTASVGGVSGTAHSASGHYTDIIKAGESQVIAFTGAGFTGALDSITVTPLAYEKVADLPELATITYQDSYFVANEVVSGRFRISGNYNGFYWPPLDFATAESSPDNLERVLNSGVGLLALIGSATTEFWTNTGDSVFPFELMSGGKVQVGTNAPYSAVALDNSIFLIGQDDNGSGIVYRTSGFSFNRISTHPIEEMLQEATNLSQAYGYSYQQDGHLFYVISGGGLKTSLAYDLTTQMWHERAYLNPQGEFEQHLASSCMFVFGKHIVGDRRNGNLYELDPETYTDNGEPIAADRIFGNLSMEGRETRLGTLEIALESGVGLESGEDPVITLRISKDGGKTYGNWYGASMGKVGNYRAKAKWRRLGLADQATFHVRITDPVKRVLIGAYMN